MGSCFCVMEDKLTKKHLKKPKCKWINYIISCSDISSEYLEWKITFKRKIKSENRLAYLFLRSKYGSKWIQLARSCPEMINNPYEVLKAKWLEE